MFGFNNSPNDETIENGQGLIQHRYFNLKYNCHFISKTLLKRNDCLENEYLSRELKTKKFFSKDAGFRRQHEAKDGDVP